MKIIIKVTFGTKREEVAGEWRILLGGGRYVVH